MLFRKPLRGALLVALLGLQLWAVPARAGTLDDVRRSGRVRIGTDSTYPPFEFMEQGRLVGFDVELGDAIARELGVRADWTPMEWAGIFPGLETGKFDLVLSGVTITEERKKGLGFSRPYFLSGQVIVRRRGDRRVAGHTSLGPRIVAVQQETTGQKAAEDLGLPRNRIRRFDTLPDALTDVRNGASDAAIGDLPALRDLIRRDFPELEIAGDVFVRENLGVVARREDRDLIAAVNRALETLLTGGEYARIHARWMGEALTTRHVAGLDVVRSAGSLAAEPETAAAGGGAAAPAPETAEAPAAPGGGLRLRPDLIPRVLPLLLQGAGLTLLLTVSALAIGIPMGLLLALGCVTQTGPLRGLITAYVEAVRGTPLLMQIYVIYFVLPSAGLRVGALEAGIAALGLNAAAYVSEIFRAGVQSIDTGQMEAARALGMDTLRAMRWVILPQTFRRVLPPLTNETVALLKDSSLVSVVALSELMRVGKELATGAGSPLTIYLLVALIYLAMTLPLTGLVRRLEARLRPGARRPRPAAAGPA